MPSAIWYRNMLEHALVAEASYVGLRDNAGDAGQDSNWPQIFSRAHLEAIEHIEDLLSEAVHIDSLTVEEIMDHLGHHHRTMLRSFLQQADVYETLKARNIDLPVKAPRKKKSVSKRK